MDANVTKEEDMKSLARLVKGNKLQYKDANSLVECILKAIVIDDGSEDVLIKHAFLITHDTVFTCNQAIIPYCNQHKSYPA